MVENFSASNNSLVSGYLEAVFSHENSLKLHIGKLQQLIDRAMSNWQRMDQFDMQQELMKLAGKFGSMMLFGTEEVRELYLENSANFMEKLE